MSTVSRHDQDIPERPRAFAKAVHELVADTAPRLFAVVEEWADEDGEPDAWVAAWGLAHEDGSAQVTTCADRTYLSLRSPERAVSFFSRSSEGTIRLVWPDSPCPPPRQETGSGSPPPSW